MNAPVPPAVTPGPLIQDTPCIGCQYNLRGLAGDGLCPECGTPIEKSLRGNFLRHADPAYVRRLASGTRILFWATLVSICMGVLAQMWWMFLYDSVVALAVRRTGTTLRAMLVSQAAWAGIALLCIALVLPGAWRVTTRDPAKVGGRRGLGLPQAIRAGLALLLIGQAFQHATMLFLYMGQDPNFFLVRLLYLRVTYVGLNVNTLQYPLMLLSLLLTLLAIAIAMGLCLWFSRLARRIPDRQLAGRTRIVMWGLPVVTLLPFITRVPLPRLQVVGILAICPEMLSWISPGLQWETLIGLLAFSIWWLILLARYRRGFMEQAGLAQGELLALETKPPARTGG